MGTRGRILFINSWDDDPRGPRGESYVACLTCSSAKPRDGVGEGVLDSIERVFRQFPQTQHDAQLLAAHLVAGEMVPHTRFLPGVLGPRPILSYEYLVVCRRVSEPKVFIQSGTMWKTEAQFAEDLDTRCRASPDEEQGSEP